MKALVHRQGLPKERLRITQRALRLEHRSEPPHRLCAGLVIAEMQPAHHGKRIGERVSRRREITLGLMEGADLAEDLGDLIVVARVQRTRQGQGGSEHARSIGVERQLPVGDADGPPELEFALRGPAKGAGIDPRRRPVHHLLEHRDVPAAGGARAGATEGVAHELGDALGLVALGLGHRQGVVGGPALRLRHGAFARLRLLGEDGPVPLVTGAVGLPDGAGETQEQRQQGRGSGPDATLVPAHELGHPVPAARRRGLDGLARKVAAQVGRECGRALVAPRAVLLHRAEDDPIQLAAHKAVEPTRVDAAPGRHLLE